MKKTMPSLIYRSQPGVVSLLTVMFFIVLVSVLGLGFLRLSINEQSQTLDDDLSRSALSAARSGVELAKKYLLDCRQGDAATCARLATTDTCGNDIVPAGGLVVGAGEFEQKVACLVIEQAPPTLVGKTIPGANGDLYPLHAANMGQGAEMIIKWHSPISGEDGLVDPGSLAGLPGVNENPAFPTWPADRPGVMRISFFTFFPNNSAATSESFATVYLKLATAGGGAATTITPGNKFINTAARCTNSTTDYICSERIILNQLPDPMPAGAIVYAHIATEYRAAFYELSGERGGSPLTFANVQPEVDSTGITSNVVRRLKTRLSYGDSGFYTRDAASAGQGICKEMFISADPDLTKFEDCP